MSLPDSNKLREKEKGEFSMSAISPGVPGVAVFNSIQRELTGKNATFEALKDFLIHSQVDTSNEYFSDNSKYAVLASQATDDQCVRESSTRLTKMF